MKRHFAVAALLLALPLQAAGYRISRHIAIGGEGSGQHGIALDATLHRLFISHGTQVEVVNLVKGKRVGSIDGLAAARSIALAQDLGRGFISNGSEIAVFQLATLSRAGDWKPAGDSPDALVYDRGTHRLFSFDGAAKSVTVFDAKTGTIIDTLALDGKPAFAVSSGDGAVYANLEDTSEVVAIDAADATVTRRWALSPCEGPAGLAYDTNNARLFSSCANRIMAVSDAKAGGVVGTVAIGEGAGGVAFDASKRLVFSTNSDGTITVVRASAGATYEVADTIQTAPDAATIVIDNQSHRLYMPAASDGGELEILDLTP